MKLGKQLTLFRGCDSSKKENAAMVSKIYTVGLCDIGDRLFFVGMNYEFLYFRNLISFVKFYVNVRGGTLLFLGNKINDFLRNPTCFYFEKLK